MGVKERREREREQMRESILSAARAIINEHGAGAIEIREIAKRIEYSPSVIYNYFDGRDAIITALFREGVDRFWSYLRSSVEGETVPVTKLTRLGQAYIQFGRENPELYQIVFGKPVPHYRLPEDALDEHNKQFQFLVDIIQECVESGDFKPGNVYGMAYITWATVHGMASLEIIGRRPAHPGAELEMMALDFIGNGWRR